jgi:hypothetical protein
MKNSIELRKVRDFGDVINDTFAFIGQNWKPLLKAYAVICGFFIVASLVFSILNQLKMTSSMGTNNPFTMGRSMRYGTYSSPFSMFGWEYFVAIFFTLVTYTSIYLTTMCFIALYREKGNIAPTPEEVWGYFKFYFFKALGTSILLGLMLGVGFVLCLIPGFYLLPALSLVIPVIVFENTTMGYAFGRGFKLIKDNYWFTLGVIIITAIIVYIAMAVIVLPLGILNASSVLLGAHKINSTYLIITAVASHICYVFYMVPAISISLCYFSLTEQVDSTGLMDRINNLGNPDQPSDQLPNEEY